MQQILRVLKTDLQKFGLNPADWTIEQVEEELYQVAHVEDQQFYFLGEIQQKDLCPEWKTLKLFSL